MKRLLNDLGANSPEEYDRIFEERRLSGVERQDMRRWEKLLKYFKGGKILDVGCLDSMIYPIAKKKYPYRDIRYLGIDTAEKAIKEMSRRYFDDQSVRFEVRNCFATELPDDFFDYVVMGELIEHLDDPLLAIREAIRILKSKGTLAISTPNNEEREYGAVDRDRHVWSFDSSSLSKFLKPYGRVRTAILGSEYFPKYVYHFPSLLVFLTKR